jgi:hypothetical protein
MAACAEAAGPTVDNAPSISFGIIARSLHRAPFAPESGSGRRPIPIRSGALAHNSSEASMLDARAMRLPPARFLV